MSYAINTIVRDEMRKVASELGCELMTDAGFYRESYQIAGTYKHRPIFIDVHLQLFAFTWGARFEALYQLPLQTPTQRQLQIGERHTMDKLFARRKGISEQTGASQVINRYDCHGSEIIIQAIQSSIDLCYDLLLCPAQIKIELKPNELRCTQPCNNLLAIEVFQVLQTMLGLASMIELADSNRL